MWEPPPAQIIDGDTTYKVNQILKVRLTRSGLEAGDNLNDLTGSLHLNVHLNVLIILQPSLRKKENIQIICY